MSNPIGETESVNSTAVPLKLRRVGCINVSSFKSIAGSHSQSNPHASPPPQLTHHSNSSKPPVAQLTLPSLVKTIEIHPSGFVAVKFEPGIFVLNVEIKSPVPSGPSKTLIQSQQVSNVPAEKLKVIIVPSPRTSGQ